MKQFFLFRKFLDHLCDHFQTVCQPGGIYLTKKLRIIFFLYSFQKAFGAEIFFQKGGIFFTGFQLASSLSYSAGKPFIFSQYKKSSNRNFFAVKGVQRSVYHFHLPEVGKMMFRTGSRSGISHHLHGKAGKDQCIHQLFTVLRLA